MKKNSVLASLRNDKTIRSAVFSFCIKPISILLNIAYVPLLLQYLGDEKYGIWATILSIINWINCCDIGIGNGLRNILTKELTLKRYERAKKAISTAYVCLSLIAGIMLFFLIAITFVVDWKRVFNTQYDVIDSLLICFVFICVNFVLALCNNILYALQKSELTSLKNVCVQMINIAGVLVLRKVSSGNLVYISILFGLSSFIVHGTTSIAIIKHHPSFSPAVSCFDKEYVKGIGGLGIKFFIAQIVALILFTTDNILVSNLFGAVQVTPFSIADKVFNSGYMVFSAIIVPFWSKSTQEIEKRNYHIIKRYFRNLNYLAGLFSLGCICVSIVFRPVVRVWLGKDLDFSNSLILVMCIYYSVYSFCAVSSTFINGMNGVDGVMYMGIVQGILNIPLSIFFAKPCGMGVVGIRLGTLVVVACGAIYQFAYFYYLINKIEKKEKTQDSARC